MYPVAIFNCDNSSSVVGCAPHELICAPIISASDRASANESKSACPAPG